jgi:hypothetical protein
MIIELTNPHCSFPYRLFGKDVEAVTETVFGIIFGLQ